MIQDPAQMRVDDRLEALERELKKLRDERRQDATMIQALATMVDDIEHNATDAMQAIENARGERGITVDRHTQNGGLRVVGPGESADDLCSFSVVSINLNVVTLRKGMVRVQGLAPYVLLPQQNVTITSVDTEAPTWVYIERQKLSGEAPVAVLKCTDTIDGPKDSAGVWTRPLYTFALDSSGSAVKLHDWRWDWTMGSPIG